MSKILHKRLRLNRGHIQIRAYLSSFLLKASISADWHMLFSISFDAALDTVIGKMPSKCKNIPLFSNHSLPRIIKRFIPLIESVAKGGRSSRSWQDRPRYTHHSGNVLSPKSADKARRKESGKWNYRVVVF